MQGGPCGQAFIAHLDFEKPRAAAAVAHFGFGGFADRFHLQVQAQGNARQGVVGVEHHVLGVDFGHGVEHVARRIGVAASGQGSALDGEAGLKAGGEEGEGLQEKQLFVEVAKGVFGLEVQVDLGAFFVALQGLFYFGQEVIAANEKFNGFVQGVQNFAQRVFECPGQCDHRRCLDFHTTIVAVWRLLFGCLVFERRSFGLSNRITPMNTEQPLALLGGLSPSQFMKRHWQKKPLLVRNAIPGFVPCVGRADLVALAGQEGVESRLIVDSPKGWKMKHGPFNKRNFPPFSQEKWTFLVQGVDLHHDGVHALLQQFRFVPDARLDDIMISYATDGGGVGPHFDSYDVFLLQAHGQRRWRIGRNKDLTLQSGVPLKILKNFEAEEELVLNPGDMLYLPPKYAHDGVALGECMTWSVGFRAPQEGELARELLMGLADEAFEGLGSALYRDPKQLAVVNPAAIPPSLAVFARQVIDKALQNPRLLDSLLGESLTEPKAQVWFESTEVVADLSGGAQLDRRTKMMYDDQHVFINGESFKVGGKDAAVLRLLADDRCISGAQVKKLSVDAHAALIDWASEGWLRAR